MADLISVFVEPRGTRFFQSRVQDVPMARLDHA
jgi:hypothetical protein